MRNDNLLKTINEEYEKDFKGWDFSHLTKSGRMKEDLLPWNYHLLINNFMKSSKIMLDMGTGGGEFLSSLSNLPEKVYATEAYLPNIPIARECLNPLGIEVREVNDPTKLPFDENTFDLIINRHEEYNEAEVKRILTDEGIFITQQVGGLNDIDINAMLGANPPDFFNWGLIGAIDKLRDEGLKVIESNESIGKTRFFDIGAIVYYLKCIPWQIKDFKAEKYLSKLSLLADFIEQHGYIDFIKHRFYVIVKKNKK